jgi:hypothetical protein
VHFNKKRNLIFGKQNLVIFCFGVKINLMVLSTHAVVGASIASFLPNHPVAGFVLGFFSHFLFDAIPHWDYKLDSAEKNEENPLNSDIKLDKRFLGDILKMVIDLTLGFFLILLVFSIKESVSAQILFWGALGGVTPDALQFVYTKFRKEPLISLQRFHIWIHAKNKIEEPFIGIICQILIALLFGISVILF